jgi:hypothetical protein
MASKAVGSPAFTPSKSGTGDGDRVLILGNSPAVQMVDLRKVPSDVITIGLNRICAHYIPDYVLAVDRTVEERFIPPVGSLRGKFVTLAGSHYTRRKDADIYKKQPRNQRPTDKWVWPRRPTDPFIIAGNTANYAFQWALVNGADEIALLGIDFNAIDLRRKRSHTHFYGYNRAAAPSGIGDVQVRFWKEAVSQGPTCIDLSPYESTPFQTRCAWPKEDFEEYCARTTARPRRATA